MKKQNKFYTTFLFALLLFTQAMAQTETFDIATYTPPTDWVKEAKGNTINYKMVNNANSTFCVITIFESTASNADASKNFAVAWKQLVATKFKTTANPESETQTTDDGWKVLTAAAPIKQDGLNVIMMLTVVSGFGKTMSIRTATNDASYTTQLDALFETMEFDKTIGTVKNIGNTSTQNNIATQNNNATEKFGAMF